MMEELSVENSGVLYPPDKSCVSQHPAGLCGVPSYGDRPPSSGTPSRQASVCFPSDRYFGVPAAGLQVLRCEDNEEAK